MKALLTVAIAAIALLAPPAWAQFGGYTVQTPGQLPTQVTPFGNGYIVNTPGQLPTTITPFGNGYTVNTPGQLPTQITPMFPNAPSRFSNYYGH